MTDLKVRQLASTLATHGKFFRPDVTRTWEQWLAYAQKVIRTIDVSDKKMAQVNLDDSYYLLIQKTASGYRVELKDHSDEDFEISVRQARYLQTGEIPVALASLIA